MCGRFALAQPESLADHFHLGGIPELAPRYNIAPSQPSPVVRVRPDNLRWQIDLLQWGLIPHWAKDAKIGHKLINARAETIAEKPAFRDAFKKRRCLIPANGFFEWKKEGDRRQPYYVTMKDGGLFAMAGLWESWINPQKEIIRTFTVITTESNSLIAQLHDRMPVIIAPEQYGLWLETSVGISPRLNQLLQPFSPYKMKYHKVSGMVNNPKNDAPGCIRKIDG